MVWSHFTHISSNFYSLLHSSLLHYVMPNNWSPDTQMWCDLLNTPISHAPLAPTSSSPVQCLVNTTPSRYLSTIFTSTIISSPIALSSPYPYAPPPVGGSSSAYAHPPYPYPPPPPPVGDSSGANAPLPYPYPPPPLYGYPPYSYPPSPTGGSSGGPTPQPYSYHPPSIYSYPPPQHAHSGGDDNSSGGDNTSDITQTSSRMKKRNEWTPVDEGKLVLLNFIISLSCMWQVCCTCNLGFLVHAWLMHSVDCIEDNSKSNTKF
jgi:hypothetical protein